MNKQREEMAWMWPGESKHSLCVPSAQALLHFYCFTHKSVNSHTWHSENCNITCWCNEPPHNIRSFLSLNFALSVLHQQPPGLSLFHLQQHFLPALHPQSVLFKYHLSSGFIVSSFPFVKIKITPNSNLSIGLWTTEIKTAGRYRDGEKRHKREKQNHSQTLQITNRAELFQNGVMSLFLKNKLYFNYAIWVTWQAICFS